MDHRRSPSRRAFGAFALVALLVAACAPAPGASPTPAAPTAAPKAAAAPTTPAGAPTAAPKVSAPAPTTAATTSPVKRGGALRLQLIRDAEAGYDPALATLSTVFTVNGLMFDTLAEIQPDGSLAPSLADSWTISPDELTYTFKIRSGVKFHNGREMTATDVKYTLERMKDPATRSPRRNIYALMASAEAPDPTTLVLKLTEPFSPFIYALADITAGVVPKEVVEAEGGTLNTKPVGTGAFKFVEWVRDQHVKLEANRDYWRPGMPYLDSVTVSFAGDSNARAAAVRSGNIDFLWNAPPELYEVLGADQSLQLYGGEGTLSWQYLLMNMQKAPFDNVKVRQAIFWALDREQIRQISRPRTTTPLNAGFLPPTHWAGLTDVVYTPDLAKARQLLTEGGQPNGFKMEVIVNTGSDFHIRSAQAMQQQLKPLGIEIEVKIMETTQSTQLRDAGNFDALVTGFSGTIDPDERFQQTFMSGGGTNYAKFTDARVDELANQARKTSNREARGKLYREAQLRIAEVGPYAFTYNYHFFDALPKYVKGYVFNPQLVDYRTIRQVWLDK